MSDAHRRLSLRGVTAEMLAVQVSDEVLLEALKLKGFIETTGPTIRVSPNGHYSSSHTKTRLSHCFWQARTPLVRPWEPRGCGQPVHLCSCQVVPYVPTVTYPRR